MADAADRLADEKRTLRRLMGDRRAGLSVAERARASAAAVERLVALREMAAVRTVSGYVALAARNEIDPAGALDEARGRGAVVVLPRISDLRPRLRFHRTGSAGDLRPGRFGLLEPDAGCPEVPVEQIDVMVLPGLAFDEAGGRLGYGGGYFDEAARELREGGRGLVVALAYDFQLVDRVPVGEGDVPVDWVVTDARAVRCVRAAKGAVS